MDLELQQRAGGTGYQGRLRGITSIIKTDSSDKTKVARFFNHVVSTKNTKKVVEKITGDDGEDVEHAISKALKLVHV